MALIKIALALAAFYSGGMYIALFLVSVLKRVDYERETFHLGLCFILAMGFLGLIVK